MASSRSVSVVVPVTGEWKYAKACLDGLRPTLGVSDQVIVVDSGVDSAVANGLRMLPWVERIAGEIDETYAAACARGAAVASKEFVAFVDVRISTPRRWLDALLSVFDDETVVAAVPSWNKGSGAQATGPVTYESPAELRRFAKEIREAHKGEAVEITQFDSVCAVVRMSTLEAAATTWSSSDDFAASLKSALTTDGGRIVLCKDAYVHCHSPGEIDWISGASAEQRFQAQRSGVSAHDRGNALLSACLIVKDEKDNLPATLSSLTDLVDEVVVYDTGSVDGTIELAEAAGAKVVRGYWDDDFSRARNDALKHCTGLWILWIDADEVFEGNRKKLRESLRSGAATAFQMSIRNLSESGGSDLYHRPLRVFRRHLYSWVGRLHEQVVPRNDDLVVQTAVLDEGLLVHSGYLPSAIAAKGKVERNIRMAEAELDNVDGRSEADKLANVGRSYLLAGRHEEGLAVMHQARALTDAPAPVRRIILRSGAHLATELQRFEEVIVWADELGAASTVQDGARFYKGTALSQLGRHVEAIAVFEGLTKIDDDDGIQYSMLPVHIHRAHSFAALQRWEEACAELDRVIGAPGGDEIIVWSEAVEAFWRTGRAMDELLECFPSGWHTIAVQLMVAEPQAVDVLLENSWTRGDLAHALAIAVRMADRLPVERALEWSNRLRENYLERHCPLLSIARDNTRSTRERILAGASAQVAFSDPQGRSCVEYVARTCDTNEFGVALTQLNELAPNLLEAFIVAGSKEGARALDLARTLHELGAEDEAVAVAVHSVSSVGGESIAGDASRWLQSVGRDKEAEEVLRT